MFRLHHATILAGFSMGLVLLEIPSQGTMWPSAGAHPAFDVRVGSCKNGVTAEEVTEACVPDISSQYSQGQDCKEDMSRSITVGIGVVSFTYSYPNGCDKSVPKQVDACSDTPSDWEETSNGGDMKLVIAGQCPKVHERRCVASPSLTRLRDYVKGEMEQDQEFMSHLEKLRLKIKDFLLRVPNIVIKTCGPKQTGKPNWSYCPSLTKSTKKKLHIQKSCAG